VASGKPDTRPYVDLEVVALGHVDGDSRVGEPIDGAGCR
jgi:hypothetical protein